MQKIIDISMPIHADMVTWNGEEKFEREEIVSGDSIISKLSMTTHTGTHIDAPRHFLGPEAPGLDEIDTSKLVGSARVIKTEEAAITAEILKSFEIKEGERVVFQTLNSKNRLLERPDFVKDYVSLDLSAAEYLVNRKISLVGIDYLGIEAKGGPAAPAGRGEPRQGRGHPVHKALLAAGVVIVEGLNLVDVEPGEYNLAVLPLKIISGDGAPARAILWR